MNLLIDINVALDVCTGRTPFAEHSAAALLHCTNNGGRLWLHTGSAQTLEYSLFLELKRDDVSASNNQLMQQTKVLLKAFSANKHWLASLSDEGDIFDSEDTETEQLIRALDRFAPGTAKILTRDTLLCNSHPELAISPQQFLQSPPQQKTVEFIDLKAQQDAIRPALERNLHRVLHHGQYIMGAEVRELEKKLEAYTGAKHCITVSSGTEALLISLMALGIKPGDEVITTPFTFVATAEVIVLLGAKPVFVDIEPDTCNINANLIEAAISAKTKAIMPVSLYGQPADMDEINAIAAKYNLPVIEDAAQSFGAEYKNKKSCNLSTFGCTSFFPSKPLGCYGDGGAIFTNDDDLAQACREIRVHGQSKRYVHTRIGVGGRMDTIQCAVILAKLERFEWEVTQRIEIGQRYNQLMDEAGLARVQQRPDRTSVFAQYTVFVENRDDVQATLKVAGIPTAVHYPVPLNEQPAYKHLCDEGCTPSAHNVATQVMSLPIGPHMPSEDQQFIMKFLVQSE